MGSIFEKLGKFFGVSRGGKSDDPVCLSALDPNTLRRYGYNERQINQMKEIGLR